MDKTKKIVAEIIDWAKYIIAGVVFALVLNNTLLLNANIASPSMEKTLMTHSTLFASRISYYFSDPERFDIIVFKFPDDEESDPYIKRIIGLPGEEVLIREGKVYIDGSEEALEDSFVNGEVYGDYGPFNVPEDSYFVMGDNRGNSWDSKNWNNKYVHQDKILGKAIFEWFPNPHILK